MGKYQAYFKTSLQHTLQYPARGFVWFLFDIAPMVIMVLFWLAAFTPDHDTVFGYNLLAMVGYYLVITFVRVVVITHPDELVSFQINSGQIAFDLIKPIAYIKAKLQYELAYKILRVIMLSVGFFGLYWWLKPGLSLTMAAVGRLAIFTLSLLISLLLCFYLRICVGLLTFWLTDIGWIIDLESLLLIFLGGGLFPLELLPSGIYQLNRVLPFTYIFYFPSQLLLKTNLGRAELYSLLAAIGWLAFFYWLSFRLLTKGRRIYTSFGG